MNDASNPSQPANEAQSQPSAGASCSSQSARCVFEPFRSAFSDGAHRAQAAAEKALPKVKAAVTSATYWFGFGVSFASVFSYTLAKGLAPEALKAGCVEGARAGRKAADDLASKAHRAAPTPGPAEAPPSDSAPQPGPA